MRKALVILFMLLVNGSVYAMTEKQFNEFEVEGLRMGLSFEKVQQILLEKGFALKPTRNKHKYQYSKPLQHGKKIRVNLTRGDDGLFSKMHIIMPNPDGKTTVQQVQGKTLSLFPNARQDCNKFNKAIFCKFKGQSVKNKLALTIHVSRKANRNGQEYTFVRAYDKKSMPRLKLIQMLMSKASSSQQQSSSQAKQKSSPRTEKESRSQTNPANQPESSSDLTSQGDKTGKTGETKAEKQSQSLAKRAQKGDAEAQYQMGLKYEQGDGKSSGDYKEAAKMYSKAAKQGHVQAQNRLAKMYDEGEGVSEDPKQAVTLLTKAAKQGDMEAAFNLGMHYLQGRGVEQSDKKAFEWFKKAAEKNHLVASYGVAMMYRNGLGTRKNVKKARGWDEKIAALEQKKSQKRAGNPGSYGETTNDIVKASTVVVPF